MGQAVIKSWVKLLYNLDQVEAADHNQIVIISYSDSDCDPPLPQTEESHQGPCIFRPIPKFLIRYYPQSPKQGL